MKRKPTYYQSKAPCISGSNDKEVFYEARQIFRKYDNKRRLPYARSRYFDGQKIFLNMFYKHLDEKPEAEHRRRIVFVPCALDLIKNSKVEPVTPPQHPKKLPAYYRFQGVSGDNRKFIVQIMRDKKNNCYFMSCFPVKNFK